MYKFKPSTLRQQRATHYGYAPGRALDPKVNRARVNSTRPTSAGAIDPVAAQITNTYLTGLYSTQGAAGLPGTYSLALSDDYCLSIPPGYAVKKTIVSRVWASLSRLQNQINVRKGKLSSTTNWDNARYTDRLADALKILDTWADTNRVDRVLGLWTFQEVMNNMNADEKGKDYAFTTEAKDLGYSARGQIFDKRLTNFLTAFLRMSQNGKIYSPVAASNARCMPKVEEEVVEEEVVVEEEQEKEEVPKLKLADFKKIYTPTDVNAIYAKMTGTERAAYNQSITAKDYNLAVDLLTAAELRIAAEAAALVAPVAMPVVPEPIEPPEVPAAYPVDYTPYYVAGALAVAGAGAYYWFYVRKPAAAK